MLDLIPELSGTGLQRKFTNKQEMSNGEKAEKTLISTLKHNPGQVTIALQNVLGQTPLLCYVHTQFYLALYMCVFIFSFPCGYF